MTTTAIARFLTAYAVAAALLALEPLMVATLTARNVLLIALLVWAVRAMVRVPRGRRY